MHTFIFFVRTSDGQLDSSQRLLCEKKRVLSFIPQSAKWNTEWPFWEIFLNATYYKCIVLRPWKCLCHKPKEVTYWIAIVNLSENWMCPTSLKTTNSVLLPKTYTVLFPHLLIDFGTRMYTTNRYEQLQPVFFTNCMQLLHLVFYCSTMDVN